MTSQAALSDAAENQAEQLCHLRYGTDSCAAVAVICNANEDSRYLYSLGMQITQLAAPVPLPASPPNQPIRQPQPAPISSPQPPTIIYLSGIAAAVSFAIGLVLALILYAARAPILNFIIHGNLPYKLPVYGEDIQCLFKRTQRINWYGRVIFGLTANLSMTHDQLTDVRKYWLGRVIAFDSLRRQRQNELARMHMQLAASARSEAHDKKKFWSRRWATLRSFVKKLFWVFIAFFNFILGFFFIRVTIAKLVQGTIVESKDLTLILQAKEAIEETATYLKEYLDTANTFDGRDEVV